MSGPRHLVLVLGMHRSGTSVITKCMEIFGVHLGNNFYPPGRDNPKGFWEDRRFHAINEALLHFHQHQWDTLKLLEPEKLLSPALELLRDNARTILNDLFQQPGMMGVKDPRFSVLLPFWQDLFQSLGIQVSPVVCLRHPACVARSLQGRNGFPETKSIWLWTLHNLGILSNLKDGARLVVEYDAFLDNPREELARLGRFLQVPPQPAALETYLTHFLDPALRHARPPVEDPHDPAGLPPVTRAIYDTLLAEARTGNRPDNSQLNKLLQESRMSCEIHQPLLDLGSELARQLQTMKDQHAEQDAELNRLRAKIKKLQKPFISFWEARRTAWYRPHSGPS